MRDRSIEVVTFDGQGGRRRTLLDVPIRENRIRLKNTAQIEIRDRGNGFQIFSVDGQNIRAIPGPGGSIVIEVAE